MTGYELRVTNIHGLIGINKSDAVINIRQPNARLEIATEPAQLNMTTRQARVKIDQRQCFNESGLKGVTELTDEFAQRGKQAVLEGIAETVDEGKRMAMIQRKSSAVAEIAAAKVFPPPDHFNITMMPKSRPKIEFEGGVSFAPRPGSVNIRAVPQQVEISATYPSINVFLLKEPYFSIEFVGKNIDINA